MNTIKTTRRMLKQNLSQRMLQKLSPQQIQLMKLLQIPTATLDQRIQEELEANPALDEGDTDDEEMQDMARTSEEKSEENSKEEKGETLDDIAEEPAAAEEFELDDYLNEYIEDDPSSYKLKANNYSADDEDKTMPIAVEHTFHEYLDEQLGMLQFANDEDEAVARQIVGSIDEDGYLRRDPLAIIDDLVFSQNIIATEEQVLCWLKKNSAI